MNQYTELRECLKELVYAWDNLSFLNVNITKAKNLLSQPQPAGWTDEDMKAFGKRVLTGEIVSFMKGSKADYDALLADYKKSKNLKP